MRKLIIVVMLSSILKFLGCSPKSKNPESINDSKQVEFNDEVRNSIEAFKNRVIHKRLTTEIIDTTSNDELLQLVFDNLSSQIPKDFNRKYDFITSEFNPSQQSIYLIWWLEGEVNNGGFNQYFANSSGQYAEIVPDLLVRIDAVKFAELAERANRLYRLNSKQITKNQDGTIEGFSKSYENNPLNKLDDEFYSLYKEEDLYTKQIEYIRKNKLDFVN